MKVYVLKGVIADDLFFTLQGASSVHFHDFNAEVLRSLTINNVTVNLEQSKGWLQRTNSDSTSNKGPAAVTDIHYYAGDWADAHNVLSIVKCGSPENGNTYDSGHFNFMFNESDWLEPEPVPASTEGINGGLSRRGSRSRLARKLSGSRACERGHTNSAQEGGYDIILMSETVYSLASLPKLYELIKKVITWFPLRDCKNGYCSGS